MKGFTKKIGALALSLTLVVGMASSASAATWKSYFGAMADDWEGAEGVEAKNTDTAFTWNISKVGWSGCWGCQASRPISLKKGTTYHISFKMTSSKVNKYVYVKMSTGESLAKGFWVKLAKGKTQTVNETFKAENAANQLTFGMGGECGNRAGVDTDANVRYAIFDKQFKEKHLQLDGLDCDGDYSSVTQLSVKNYKLVTVPKKVTLKSAKAKGKKKVKVTWKKAAGIASYQIKVGSKKFKATGTSKTVKAKKKGKQAVQVRGVSAKNYTDKKVTYTGWSKKKKVKVK